MRCSLLTLSCYLDSELDARQQGEMEAHLVGCPRCRAGLSHLREEVERVGGLARVRVPDRSARALRLEQNSRSPLCVLSLGAVAAGVGIGGRSW